MSIALTRKQKIFESPLSSNTLYVLWVRFVKSTRNLFNIYFFPCSNALHIWSWIQQIFLTSHFSDKDDLLSFIKSDGSPLVNLIRLDVITFSI